jgi:hypothetical protein
VPVATAMMQLGQAGTGAKTGLAFEHDQASIAREENSLDYVSIFGKLKYEIGYATSTKYETFVTKFGVRHVQGNLASCVSHSVSCH